MSMQVSVCCPWNSSVLAPSQCDNESLETHPLKFFPPALSQQQTSQTENNRIVSMPRCISYANWHRTRASCRHIINPSNRKWAKKRKFHTFSLMEQRTCNLSSHLHLSNVTFVSIINYSNTDLSLKTNSATTCYSLLVFTSRWYLPRQSRYRWQNSRCTTQVLEPSGCPTRRLFSIPLT